MSNDPAPRRGRLIVISGPTASGKSTLWRRLVQRPGVTFSVSATTRPPRAGETDGRDYHFVGEEEFTRRVAAGEFLEWAHVHGRRYGTLRGEVEAAVSAGRDIVLEIDVQGARNLRASGVAALTIFVLPPSLEVLERRLRARGTEGAAEMRRRLDVVREELSHAREYDHCVVNDDLEQMVAEVEALLGYGAQEARR
jgi:guanylate kinase